MKVQSDDKFADVASLVGRTLLAAVFLPSGLAKIGSFEATSQFMANAGMPLVTAALVAAIAFEIVFGLFILAGFATRIASAGLILFVVLATYYFHPAWAFEGQQRQMEIIQMFKNGAIAGGLLMLAAFGPGGWSVARMLTWNGPGSPGRTQPADGGTPR